MTDSAAAFRTLHVCTGNIARSASAELLMRAFLSAHGAISTSFTVASAGTWGHEGSPIEPDAASVLGERGIDASGFRARALTVEHIEQADLVLAATREHRAAVVNLLPSAVRRTFTLKEFARLCQLTPGEATPAGLVAAAAATRGYPVPSSAADDDVEDPYGAPRSVYEVRLAEIELAVERVVGSLLATA